MSSYFDNIRKQVQELSRQCSHDLDGDHAFLDGLKRIEAPMIKACELFAGDIETPEDARQAIMGCIALHRILSWQGELANSSSSRYALATKSSRLEREMHSLWHDIARMRYQMRYGLVMDNPAAAVAARDSWVANRKGPHPWQQHPPTAGNKPLVFHDYQPPKFRAPEDRRETQSA